MTMKHVASGGISAAAALAAGSGAYAGIVAVAPPANLPNAAAPATSGPITWDVDGDSVPDFVFSFRNPQSPGPANGVLWQANMAPAVPLGIGAVAGYLGPFV